MDGNEIHIYCLVLKIYQYSARQQKNMEQLMIHVFSYITFYMIFVGKVLSMCTSSNVSVYVSTSIAKIIC